MVAVEAVDRRGAATRKWTLTLDGVTYDVVLNGGTISVNGRTYATTVDGQTVQVDGNRYDVEVLGGRVRVNGVTYQHDVKELQNGAKAASTSGTRGGPAATHQGAIKAIMPGKVIRLAVSEGDVVKEGDLVLILEAMKMENEIRAPRAGKVRGLRASKGSDVEMGQVLCEIECGAVDE